MPLNADRIRGRAHLAASTPIDDYAEGLALLTATAHDGISAVIPGHGRIACGDEIDSRIAIDDAHLRALQQGREITDPRVGPQATYGEDWLPQAHRQQVRLVRTRPQWPTGPTSTLPCAPAQSPHPSRERSLSSPAALVSPWAPHRTIAHG